MLLTDIAVAWYKVITGVTPHEAEVSRQRLTVCDSCPYKVQMNAMGSLVMSALNQADNTFYCGQCGCPLAAKAVSDRLCPLGKWPEQQQADYF